MTLIAVEGQGRSSHRAELGRVRVGVSITGKDRSEVLDQATRAYGSLVEQLSRYADEGVVAVWASQAVFAYAFNDWSMKGDKERSVRRFRATASLSADFTDFEELSRWLPDVAETDGVEIDGVDWRLTAETRDRLLVEVRAEAARETRSRAVAYAEAIGLGEPRVIALYEDGLRPGGGSDGPGRHVTAAMRGEMHLEARQLDLEPPEVEVAVSVSADYEADDAR